MPNLDWEKTKADDFVVRQDKCGVEASLLGCLRFSDTSPFNPSQLNPFQEIALGKKENNHQRQCDQGGSRHHEAPFGGALRPEGEEAQGEGILIVIGKIDKRPKKVVPSPEKGEDGHDQQGRSHQG